MKEQKFSQFIGIDLSKNTFDVAIFLPDDKQSSSYVFENSKKGIKAFFTLLKNNKFKLENCFICMEHTGVYGRLLIAKLVEKEACFTVEMSLKIIRSMGLLRGKNDRIDAVRIAHYAHKNHESLELYQAPPIVLEKIRILMSLRDQVVQFNADLKKHPNELNKFDPELAKLANKSIKTLLKQLKEQVKRLEDKITVLISEDEKLSRTIALTTSVPGVGKITALQIAISTNLYTKCENPKQLACYSGVVPFEQSSGTSLNKRPRVHHMANKTIKKLLHMAAMSAITHDEEIRHYYLRKVEEGKSKMLVINNVRNKLIHRVYAVIKRDEPYVKKSA
jgi:transposase